MTAARTIALVSACPTLGCHGDIYLPAGSPNIYVCTAEPLAHQYPADDLAACTRCTGPQNSDRETVTQALAGTGVTGEAWLLIEGQGLVCPEHLALCRHCGDPCLLEDARCAEGEHEYHCPDCGDGCGACAKDAHDMREYAGYKERWLDD